MWTFEAEARGQRRRDDPSRLCKYGCPNRMLMVRSEMLIASFPTCWSTKELKTETGPSTVAAAVLRSSLSHSVCFGAGFFFFLSCKDAEVMILHKRLETLWMENEEERGAAK